MSRIFTHRNLDLDAVLSVLAATKFIPGFKDAEIRFMDADWDGEGMKVTDLAVDLYAGGYGIKGKAEKDGTTHSCFAYIMSEYAPPEIQEDLKYLIRFVDLQDISGSVCKLLLSGLPSETAQIFDRTGLNQVFRAFQAEFPRQDLRVLAQMRIFFSGTIKTAHARRAAIPEADKAEILPGRKVAILADSRRMAVPGTLFDRGIKAIIYVDGFNLGVIREGSETSWRADDPKIKTVVEAAGELKEWFSHPAGFLFCRGSRKALAMTPSKVNPRDLANAVNELLNQ